MGFEGSDPEVPATAIVALFVSGCALLAFTLNIWQDEAYSLSTTGGGVAHALRAALRFEAQAPLYFVVLALWRTLGESVFEARCLSIALSLATLSVTWLFARRYIDGIHPALVLGAVAFNPFVVWASLEIRPYAAAVMLSTLLVYLFFRGFVDERPNAPARFAYAAFTIVAVYTQYYLGGLLVAGALALLVLRRRAMYGRYAATATFAAIAMYPIATIVPQQLASYGALAAAIPLPGYTIAIAVLDFLFPHGWIGTWAHQPLSNAIYAGLVAVPVSLALRFMRRLDQVSQALLAIVGTVCALFFAVIALGHQHVIVPRHAAVLLGPTLFAAFAVLARVRTEQRRLALGAFLSVYGAFAGLTLWREHHALAKPGDWRRVAAYVTRHAAPAEPVAIFDAEAELPFQFYFRGANPIRPIPRAMSLDHFDQRDFVLRSEADVAHALGGASAAYGRVWLVRNDACQARARFYGCDFLDAYVANNFRVARTERFLGATVVELRPLPTATLPSGLAAVPARVRTFLYFGGEHVNEDLPAEFIAQEADFTEQAIGQADLATAFKRAGGAHAVAYTDVAYNVYCGEPYGPDPRPSKCRGPWGNDLPEKGYFHDASGARIHRRQPQPYGAQEAFDPATLETRRAYAEHTRTLVAESSAWDYFEADDAGKRLDSIWYGFNAPGVEITRDSEWIAAHSLLLAGAARPILLNGASYDWRPELQDAFLLTPNVAGAFNENCFSTDYGSGYMTDRRWRSEADAILDVLANRRLDICWGEYPGGGQSAAHRLYHFASWLLTYDPAYSVIFPMFRAPDRGPKGAEISVYDEEHLVPMAPRETASRSIAQLARKQLYVREFRSCFYARRPIGACAALVNPSDSESAAVPPLDANYRRTLSLPARSLYGGGKIEWKPGTPDTLGPRSAEILAE
jgi:hypothetical protein